MRLEGVRKRHRRRIERLDSGNRRVYEHFMKQVRLGAVVMLLGIAFCLMLALTD